jgi:hypothetical protein
LGELGTAAGASSSLTLVDNTIPRVALQFSSDNGQDNGSVVLFNLASTDETGELVYDGQTRLVYPKLNLTASLYDQFGLRGRSEDLAAAAGDNNITGSANLTDDLVTQALATPLLATVSATTTTPGTTASGSSTNVYTPADYTAWSGTTTTTTNSCVYLFADSGTVTTIYEVSAAGGETINSTTAASTTYTVTDYVGASFADHTFTSAITVVDAITGASTTSTAGKVGPTGCVVTTTTTNNPQRTLVVEMTEDVDTITYGAAFRSTEGAALDNGDDFTVRTNVIAGSDLETEIDNLTNVSAG